MLHLLQPFYGAGGRTQALLILPLRYIPAPFVTFLKTELYLRMFLLLPIDYIRGELSIYFLPKTSVSLILKSK